MSYLFFFLTLITVILLILGLAKPQVYKRFFKNGVTRKKVLILFGSVTLLLFFLFIVFVVVEEPTNPPVINKQSSEKITESKTENTTSTEDVKFKILNDNSEGDTQIVSILMDSHNESEIEKATAKIRTDTCKKQCNIEVWDDKQAFEWQKQIDTLIADGIAEDMPYNKVFSDNEIEAQKMRVEHCKYIGDHFTASSTFDSPDALWMNPLKEENCVQDNQKVLDQYLEGNRKLESI